MSNSSIWSIDRTRVSATTPGQSGPWSNGNEGYIAFLKSLALLELHCLIVLCQIRILVGGILPLSRDVVGVFFGPGRMGLLKKVVHKIGPPEENIITYTNLRSFFFNGFLPCFKAFSIITIQCWFPYKLDCHWFKEEIETKNLPFRILKDFNHFFKIMY